MNQCETRNTKLQRSVLFYIVDGEDLCISSIDLSSVNSHEWKLHKSGKLDVSEIYPNCMLNSF